MDFNKKCICFLELNSDTFHNVHLGGICFRALRVDLKRTVLTIDYVTFHNVLRHIVDEIHFTTKQYLI